MSQPQPDPVEPTPPPGQDVSDPDVDRLLDDETPPPLDKEPIPLPPVPPTRD